MTPSRFDTAPATDPIAVGARGALPIPPMRADAARGAAPRCESGSATVISAIFPTCRLALDAQVVTARVAASCLLAPNPGDRIAWWRDEAGAHWVTAVLIRDADGPASVVLPADSQLTTQSGSMTLAPAGTLSLRGREIDVATQSIVAVTRSLQASLGVARMIGGTLATVFERLTSHAQFQHRVVEGLDQVQAGTLDHRARGVAQLSGETVVVNGERLIKQRAAQIHMG